MINFQACIKCGQANSLTDVNDDVKMYECTHCQSSFSYADVLEIAYRSIEKIEFSVGGFHQGFYDFVFDFKSGIVSYEHRLTMNAPVVKRLEDVAAEEQRVKSMKVLEWDESYSHPHILDGEQWSIDIHCVHESFHKAGSNAYPKQWRKFCNWVNRLVEPNDDPIQ